MADAGRTILVWLLLSLAMMPGYADSPHAQRSKQVDESMSIRIATFNGSLYGKAAGQVEARLRDGADSQAAKLAAIVQAVRPDVLLLNEIDHDSNHRVAQLLAEKFFAVSQFAQEPIRYAHATSFPSNTGIDSGLDLNRNGKRGDPNDAWGYGVYPGQYAMAVFSRFPILHDSVRAFQTLRWSQLPDAAKPQHPATGEFYYDDATWNRLRLSSKNHLDIPLQIEGTTLHMLASHPTPPVFDGPEDHNGCRNHDEIRFWAEYLKGEAQPWLQDDQGQVGGLEHGAHFVIVGDLNADPLNGDGRRAAIRQLLEHERVIDPFAIDIGSSATATQTQDSRQRTIATADFGRAGKMRVDYVLPSRTLRMLDRGVYWPESEKPESAWLSASDHRLVWVDVKFGDRSSDGAQDGGRDIRKGSGETP